MPGLPHFTIVFWNTWFDMQNGTKGSGDQICSRITELIDEYSPDAFGLNEVYRQSTNGRSPVIEHLEDTGYYTYFAPLITAREGWVTGNLFASKQKPVQIDTLAFGKDAQSHIGWYRSYTPNIIESKLRIGSSDITILTTHLCVMVPSDILTHISHRRSYNQLASGYTTSDLIIGGDFNELKYMPPWLHLPRHMRRLTGTLRNQTWLLDAKQSHILRGNMDNILYDTTGRLQLQAFRVLERYPSDHTPLLATFQVAD